MPNLKAMMHNSLYNNVYENNMILVIFVNKIDYRHTLFEPSGIEAYNEGIIRV